MSLSEGELVLLVDRKGRRYMLTLDASAEFHSHHGFIAHNDIIGSVEGASVTTSKGGKLRVLRPTWADFVLKMPRGAQVIYPKDVGQILVEADIFPGARVLEAGTGSGSLTLALLRAVGPSGVVHTFDIREDFQTKALSNVSTFIGEGQHHGRLEAEIADVYSDPIDVTVDRAVLDLTEPWRAVPTLERCLEPGGIVCVYVPTVPQMQKVFEALTSGWDHVRGFETLRRGWTVEGLSVRPDHRMVAHTAFLIVARRVAA